MSSPASGDLSASASTVERGVMVDVRDVTRTYGSGPTATAVPLLAERLA